MEKVLILSSGKCNWAKCYACGWGKLDAGRPDPEKLKETINRLDLSGVDKLKVFASGSFLDDEQFPREWRQWFAEEMRKKGVKQIVIESRPEFITDDNLDDFKGLNVTVSIGLENAHDEILAKYMKGFTTADYVKAVNTIRKHGFRVRSYLMVNMPFVQDIEKDLQESVGFALKHTDELVLINTFPHSKAKLFDDWVAGTWKPMSKKEFEAVVGKYKDEKIETDFDNYLFIPKFPPDKREELKGATLSVLKHPHVEVWQDYFQRFYEHPKDRAVLFLPCSFRKPYSKSSTHKMIYGTLRSLGVLDKVHRVVVSNPGVIPIEFDKYYPFNSYDWPEWEETPELMKEYIAVTKERVKKYLENHEYKQCLAYFKPSAETFIAIKQACEELGIKLEPLLDEDVYDKVKDLKNPIIQPEAIECFKKRIAEVLK